MPKRKRKAPKPKVRVAESLYELLQQEDVQESSVSESLRELEASSADVVAATVNHRFPQRQTMLHTAAKLGLATVLQKLLDLGAKVDPVNADGETPLYLACYPKSDPPTVRALLSARADPNRANKWNSSPFKLYCGGTQPEVDILKQFVQVGANLNLPDDRGRTAICEARHGYVVEFLVQHGANPNVKMEHGFTACHRASASGNVELVQALLAAGANPNTHLDPGKDDGFSPLHSACWSGHTEVVRRLLAGGADAAALSHYYRRTPLNTAIFRGHASVVAALLQDQTNNVLFASSGRSDGIPIQMALRQHGFAHPIFRMLLLHHISMMGLLTGPEDSGP